MSEPLRTGIVRKKVPCAELQPDSRVLAPQLENRDVLKNSLHTYDFSCD